MDFKKSLYIKISTFFLSFVLSIGLVFGQDEISTDEAVVAKGKSIFSNNCTSCHNTPGGGTLTGPDLMDVHKRRSAEWIKSFIYNSQKVIQSGDPYAVKLYNEYNQTPMTIHDFFSDEELDALVAYLKYASENPEVTEETTAGTDGTEGGEAGTAEDSGVGNQILYALVALVLIVLVVTLAIINKVVSNMASKKEDLTEGERELVNQKFDISYLWKAKWIRGIVTVVIILWVCGAVLDWVMNIGIQKGYAPTQPIAFSHRIHAGSEADGGHEIDCNYCHTGVRKSKNANIPSPNICMNCHREIKKESSEIKKIYAAVESGKPIEWVRIHNLPDLAYFNHSQHVKVGEIECQKCHGPIETMDVVKQHADLTMGWCINCHRETEVKAKGNAYYDKLLEIHEDKTKEPMTVKDIGGLECAKCHY